MYQRIPRLTIEEYLGLDEASEHKWEYEDGRVYCLTGFANNHAIIAANVGIALHFALGGRPGMIMIGQKVIVAARKHYYPDLVVSCDEREDGNDVVVRYPLLIAEALSPSTERRDKGAKLLAYHQVASIENILLIATNQPAVFVYERDKEAPGQWSSHKYDASQPTIYLASLGLSIQLADLYRRTTLALKSE
jgi:Uma2 family endonuclease